jgi:hypothetical protein
MSNSPYTGQVTKNPMQHIAQTLGLQAHPALVSYEQQDISDTVDQPMRAKISGEDSVLPRIIVCGHQCSGKSSVLEAISQLQFPNGPGQSQRTRFATEVVLRNDPSPVAKPPTVNILADHHRAPLERAKIEDFSFAIDAETPGGILDAVRAAEKHLETHDPGKSVWLDRLHIEFSSPKQPNLMLVDLPGLIQNEHFSGSGDRERIKHLAERYISQPTATILAVTSATTDICTEEVIDLVMKSGDAIHRTLGIVTKVDNMYADSGEESMAVVIARIEAVTFGLGWHLLANMDYREAIGSFERPGEAERTFFSKSPWSQLSQKDKGSAALREKLLIAQRDNSDDNSSIASIESLFSHDSSISSVSSAIFEVESVAFDSAIDLFVSTALKDQDLRAALSHATSRIPRKRFLNNNRRLLKRFYLDLAARAQSEPEKRAALILQSRRRREVISSRMYGSLTTTDDLSQLQARVTNEDNAAMIVDMLHTTSSVELTDGRAQDDVASGSELSDDGFVDTGMEEPDKDQKITLEMIKKFIFSTEPFEAYKATVRGFVHPRSPSVLQKLISAGDIGLVQQALEEDLEKVAREEFDWLNDLVITGYKIHEIAELLVDVEADSPWLYIESTEAHLYPVDPDFHHASCIHNAISGPRYNLRHFGDSLPKLLRCSGIEPEQRDTIRHQIDERCGFAGIFPSRAPSREWDGEVRFVEDEGFTTAIVSYGTTADSIPLLKRFRVIGSRLRSAFGLLQHHSICCSAFTMLTRSHAKSATRVLDLRRVEVGRVLPFLDLLDQSHSVNPSYLRQLCTSAGTVLDNLMPNYLEDSLRQLGDESLVEQAHHLASLALQMISVGLLCYSHAHIGPIQPYFLTKSVQRVILIGCHRLNDISEGFQCLRITGEPTQLTCLSGLVGDPVMAFRLHGEPAMRENQHEGHFDVVAAPIDILDTWGSALLVVRTDLANAGDIFAIEIGGGVLFKPRRPLDALHWQRLTPNVDLMTLLSMSQSFCLNARIRIGAVGVNSQCPMQHADTQRMFVNACVDQLYNLGTSRPYWYHKSSQVNLSGGQYAVIQVAAGFEKRDGVSVKNKISKRIESLSSVLCLDDLEACYGLEISLCTGVARRVPTRSLLANALPAFVDSCVPRPPHWDNLGPDLIDALKSMDFKSWFIATSKDQQAATITALSDLLIHLMDTGIDTEGNLRVACNAPGLIHQCFKIHCTELNAWAKILEDTDHCATFACTTMECLETPEIKCRASAGPCWRNESQSLTTEVCRYPTTYSGPVVQSYQPLVLMEDRMHLIGPIDSGLVACVRLTKPPTLEISRDILRRVPEKHRQRLKFIRRERLRERGALLVDGNHGVTVTVRSRTG